MSETAVYRVESKAEILVKQYGIKDSKPNEHFIKAVQKAAAAKEMTVAKYRDKILFPHGKERIIKRFQKFIAQHPNAEGKLKTIDSYFLVISPSVQWSM